jgi:hypothetical protein
MKVVGNEREFRWDEPLWRHFKTERFLSFIEASSLYFAAPFGFPIDPRYAEYEDLEKIFEGFRHLVKINCWHRSDYESNAMWQLYAGVNKGVAICSTPDRMRTALKPFRLKPEYAEEQLFCGNIKYVVSAGLKGSQFDRFDGHQ